MKNILLILCIGMLFAVATVINVYADNGGTDVGSGIFNANVIQPLKMTVHPSPGPSLKGIKIPQGTTRTLPVNYLTYNINGDAKAGISLTHTNTAESGKGLSVTVCWTKSQYYNPSPNKEDWDPFLTTDNISDDGDYYVRVYFLTATTTPTAELCMHIIPQSLTVEYTY